jgi:hypothetical protein
MSRFAFAMGVLLVAGCGASTETDAGPKTTDVSVDLLGSWHTCSEQLTFTSAGAWSFADEKRGCTAEGTWAGSGDRIDLVPTKGDCASAPEGASDVQVVRTQTTLTLVYPAGRIDSFIGVSQPRVRYRLTGDGVEPPTGGASILRIVGDESSGHRSACYWSEDGVCGGLLSCNGSVDQWTLEGTVLTGKLGCGGGCPCAAIFEGQQLEPGHLKGTFLGADCNKTFSGGFDAIVIAEP